MSFVDLCIHVQALRRRAEEIRSPLAPALGVASSVYTHQVANVLRVLTDVRVRHLLADEVGLGKTVQALMIFNALRRQRPGLCALVVVPTRLAPQWLDELQCRGHYDRDAAEDGHFVRLATPGRPGANAEGAIQALLSAKDISPEHFQLLIVDELHQLPADIQQQVLRVASEFEHLLVLTATPSFQDPPRHAQLFRLLEPERAERAMWEVIAQRDGEGPWAHGTDPTAWSNEAAQRVVDGMLALEGFTEDEPSPGDLAAAAMARCAYRRVVRTRRVDYGAVLPRRNHRPVVVEPLEAEVKRQELMWRYLTRGDPNAARDRVLLAKRVILSPPSLAERVRALPPAQEHDGLLGEVKSLAHRRHGDSRLDALVDLLAELWASRPDERVLVAAQDNPTVDYLFELVKARLPEVGPEGKRRALSAATLRQGAQGGQLGGFGEANDRALMEFQRGQAQVLFAAEAAQVGLNLQCARVIVLYSVPWKPVEVEQWIGRIDRIGNAAAFDDGGGARTIDVYTITQRGLVDEKVVAVLQRFRVFERGVNLDGEHLEDLSRRIEVAALGPAAVAWGELESAAERMSTDDEGHELRSALRPHLPWNVGWAQARRALLDAMPPVGPILCELPAGASTGPAAWDRCVEPVFKLLARAGDYDLRWKADAETGARFRTLWYQFGAPAYGHHPVRARVKFNFGEDPAHGWRPQHAHAFITRRGDVGSPPRRDVHLTIGQQTFRRPLRFASFGDALHDELIDGWVALPPKEQSLRVTYVNDHALWRHTEPGWFVLRMTLLDPAEAMNRATTLNRTLEAIAREAPPVGAAQLQLLMEPFKRAATCAMEADERWLRALLPAGAETTAHRMNGDAWEPVGDAVTAALVNPLAHLGNGVPQGTAIPAGPELNCALDKLAALRGGGRCGREVWSSAMPALQRAVRERAIVLAAEAEDAVELANQAQQRAKAAVLDAEAHGNPAQVTLKRNHRDKAVALARMTAVYWHERAAWLNGVEEAVGDIRPRELLSSVIRARMPN
jgi:ATP-dependent helicase HepA